MRPGDEFAGRYVLKEVIGTGRSGDVWLAHDTLVGDDVALKPERISGDRETAVRRLLSEPRAMVKFRDHPHVVTLLDVVPVTQDGAETYWFIMEYVPGGGLDRQPRLSLERAASVGAQLADALAALHDAGLVHCDVKPANVGLTQRDDAKLLDFGAAYRFRGTETVTVNGPSSFTPDYAAPELARGNIPQPASDVFGLAATLHALVTGSPPRGGEPEGDYLGEGEEEQDAERLRYWRAEQGEVRVDADRVGPLYPVLDAMLQRDPRQRPDAAEAKRLLEAVAAAGPGSRRPEPDEPPRSTERPRRRWPVLAAVLGVALIALGLVLLPDDDDPDDVPADDEPLTLIGDPHTADICSLFDRSALGRYGTPQVDVDFGNFDSCEVIVRTDDRARVDVSIRLLPGSPPESSEPDWSLGEIGVMKEPPESKECTLKLLPPDAEANGIVLQVRAKLEEAIPLPGGGATLCGVAGVAAEGAAKVLNQGPIPQRAKPFRDESLAWLNACELLDAKALSTTVPDLAKDTPEVGVADWECEWSSDEPDLEAEVRFHRDQPKSADQGTVIQLGNHRAVVVNGEEDEETCTVLVEHREYGGHNTETFAEMVRLEVGGALPRKELCRLATELATAAEARMPPA